MYTRRMNVAPRLDRRGLWLIGVLNLQLAAEVLRKYVIHSSAVLLFAEAAVVASAALVLLLRPRVQLAAIVLWSALATAWALATVLWTHQSLPLAVVGLRGVAISVAVIVISIHLFRSLAAHLVADALYSIAKFWLVVIGSVALLQLVLGPGHPLNQVAEGLGPDEDAGMGGYGTQDVALEYMFRPTSLFLHTGKFGQVAFVLAAYCLFYRAIRGASSVPNTALWTSLEIVVVATTGQRAAMAAYFIALVCLSFHPRHFRPAAAAAMALLVMGAIVLSVVPEAAELAHLVAARAWDGVVDVPNRFADTVVAPFSVVFYELGIFGQGAGTFSLGALAYGGRAMHDVIQIGEPEGSWLRLTAELGLPGLLLFGALIAGLVIRSVHVVVRLRGTADQDGRSLIALAAFNAYLLVVLSVWAGTHDVFGSTTTMSVAFWFAGALFVWWTPARAIARAVRPL
jgi:hypothetical protein